MKQTNELIEIKVHKLVHGGQALGELGDGRKVFVWNALPGEVVKARLIKFKRSYAEAIAEEILEPSVERIRPAEDNYLATSPWQIMSFEAENRYKKNIIEELFHHEGISLPRLDEVITDGNEWYYRNKMEYSFWGDEQGLHLALHQRGSHGKHIVAGSKLAMSAIDTAANAITEQLNRLQIRAGDLKTIIVRCDQSGNAAAALYTKLTDFEQMQLPGQLQAMRVHYSNPKSPASVRTKLLYELGNCQLTDELLGKRFMYDVDSFFQVNIPIFEKALADIKQYCHAKELVDMYAGVGTIGLSVAEESVELIELDEASAAMARLNARDSGLKVEVIQASTTDALQNISQYKTIIFDPPRAGLHPKIIERLLDVKPPRIIYLSCNPATQARDLARLRSAYKIEDFNIYNFFPRTPHIETLAILARKG